MDPARCDTMEADIFFEKRGIFTRYFCILYIDYKDAKMSDCVHDVGILP